MLASPRVQDPAMSMSMLLAMQLATTRPTLPGSIPSSSPTSAVIVRTLRWPAASAEASVSSVISRLWSTATISAAATTTRSAVRSPVPHPRSTTRLGWRAAVSESRRAASTASVADQRRSCWFGSQQGAPAAGHQLPGRPVDYKPRPAVFTHRFATSGGPAGS